MHPSECFVKCLFDGRWWDNKKYDIQWHRLYYLRLLQSVASDAAQYFGVVIARLSVASV